MGEVVVSARGAFDSNRKMKVSCVEAAYEDRLLPDVAQCRLESWFMGLDFLFVTSIIQYVSWYKSQHQPLYPRIAVGTRDVTRCADTLDQSGYTKHQNT